MTIADEKPRFLRVFAVMKKLPAKKLEYKPAAKSRTGLQLAQTIAHESVMLLSLVKSGDFKMKVPPLGAMVQIEKVFAKMFGEIEKVASKVSQADWKKEAVLDTGDEHPWKSPRGMMALSFLLDLIHHRGQLSTYLRPMGGKNPSIYGPSADVRG